MHYYTVTGPADGVNLAKGETREDFQKEHADTGKESEPLTKSPCMGRVMTRVPSLPGLFSLCTSQEAFAVSCFLKRGGFMSNLPQLTGKCLEGGSCNLHILKAPRQPSTLFRT